MPVIQRAVRAWNAFRANTQEEQQVDSPQYGLGANIGYNPSRQTVRVLNDRSIVTSIYNRIAIDVAGVAFRHVLIDDQGRYSKDLETHFNQCLVLEPNLDQGPRAFRQDIAMTLFDKGVAAVVPVDTVRNPKTNDAFDIVTMRVGEITAWHPKHVRVNLYNEETGMREEIALEKRMVAIVENPLYSVMNAPNSTLQRLIRKLQLLDVVDEQSSSGKLDIIIQLPYVIKTEAKKLQAEQRRQDIEFQLKGSQYGIAYTDGTEKITQLNRPAENNLLKQVEFLTSMLYGQLGITEDIMNGTADEKTMLNYFNRTIEPIVDAVIEAMQRSFLTNGGTHKRERVKYFRDPFKLVPVNDLAEIADKFTRNEILTANEIRGFMGIAPSKDPKADQLVNSNMPQPEESSGTSSLERNSQNES